MNMSQLKALDPYRFTLEDKTHPVIFYGTRELIEAMDEKVREQITNVAGLPGLVNSAMTMPDAHWGYGFPIGGVAAFDANRGGVISAGGVGFDISCGIRTLCSNLTKEDIVNNAEKLAETLFSIIPAGVGVEGHLRVSLHELENIMQEGARFAVKKGYGTKEDLEYIEEKGCIQGALPENVSMRAKERQLGEMGTLGSGNHYLEVQVVSQIFDEDAARAFDLHLNQIVISIHCGSRGLGHQIGTDYLVTLAKEAHRLGVTLPDRELACAPILSPEGQKYIGAMHSGINCALANRQILTELARRGFQQVIPKTELKTLFDVSHNTCKRETHIVNGKSQEIYIHRKGATRAFGPKHPALPQKYFHVGQPVCIGGSMGTASYILAGNAENSAFSSACHGAGRQMSRHQALKLWRGQELITSLEKEGIYIRSRSMRGVAEEAPDSYKDVHKVVQATEFAGLARRVVLLKPLVCIKG